MAAEAGLKALAALLKAAAMETELAGSRSGALRGVAGEMPNIAKYIGKTARGIGSKFGKPGASARQDIESAVNTGAGKALSKFDFFSPTQKPLPVVMRGKIGKEVEETVPRLGNIPLSRELQNIQTKISKLSETHRNKFGEEPSSRLLSKFLKSKFNLDVPVEHVDKLRAGIIPRGGPHAEQGQLPKEILRLDAPVKGTTGKASRSVGELLPADITEHPEAFSQGPRAERPELEIRNLLDSLSDKQRNALLAYYGEEKTQTEIAKELGISQPAVVKLISKGVKHLQEGLGRKTVRRGRVKNIGKPERSVEE